MIRIRYFASLRESLGQDEETLELPSGVASVGALRDHLRARGTPWAEALDDARPLMAAVNQDFARPDTPIGHGDEVAFFPPVTGG